MIDKKSMIDLVFHQLAVPAVADISPENKIFANPNLKDYDYDPNSRPTCSKRPAIT